MSGDVELFLWFVQCSYSNINEVLSTLLFTILPGVPHIFLLLCVWYDDSLYILIIVFLVEPTTVCIICSPQVFRTWPCLLLQHLCSILSCISGTDLRYIFLVAPSEDYMPNINIFILVHVL